MPSDLSRRHFFHLTAGAGALIGPGAYLLRGQQPPALPPAPGQTTAAPTTPDQPPSPPVTDPVYVYPKKSVVAVIRGEDRRKNVSTALEAIDVAPADERGGAHVRREQQGCRRHAGEDGRKLFYDLL